MFAYIALASWPVVTIMLFALLSPARALAWSVLGAYLFLPVGTSFEIPIVPALDKTSIPNLSILICCMIFVREKWLAAFKQPFLLLLMAVFVLSPFMTALGNPEPLQVSERAIPAMTLYDALAQATVNSIMLIPFIAGFGLFKTELQQRQLISILGFAVLAYSILMIVEIWFSPQLHRFIYGFFPHSFAQQIRADGFRPVVFLGHGLLVAIFCAMGIAAVIAQWRLSKSAKKPTAALAIAYLSALLILCKSFGALLLAFTFAPFVAFLRAKRITVIAALVCLAVLLYPMMRSIGIVPVQTISEMVNSYSEERGSSLSVRLLNEDQLLEKASQKPLFGWGSWGRNRIYSQNDGRDLSITDGAWIITLSTWGWIGYTSAFGLFCFGSIRLLFNSKAYRSVSYPAAAICVIHAINLLDSIPNDSIRPLTWLFAGALAAAACMHPKRQEPKIKHIGESGIIQSGVVTRPSTSGN
jgi:hypothetical protein